MGAARAERFSGWMNRRGDFSRPRTSIRGMSVIDAWRATEVAPTSRPYKSPLQVAPTRRANQPPLREKLHRPSNAKEVDSIGSVRVKYINTIPAEPGEPYLSEGSASRSFRERSQFSPFYLEPVSPYGRLSVVLRHIGRGLAPGGRPSFLLYDKKEGKETYPAVAPPSGVPSFRQCRAGSSQTRPAGSDMRSPFSARHHLQSARQRGEEMQVINGPLPNPVSVKARCV